MFPHSDHPAAIDLIHLLVRATHSIQREFDAQLAALQIPYPISGPRLRLLSVVAESGQIRMSDLAAKLGIKARTVTDFVDALEQDNLLVRVPDPTDRRAILIRLTELAQSNIDHVLALQAEIAEKLLGNLSAEQRNQFFSLLLHLMENKDMSNPCEEALK